MMVKPKRGRPKKPFFDNHAHEQHRLDCNRRRTSVFMDEFMQQSIASGEQATRELMEETGPGVPFHLVLALNDSDYFGRPTCDVAADRIYDAAMAKRRQSAADGGRARHAPNHAAIIIREEGPYIREKLAHGWSNSRIFKEIERRRAQKGQPVSSRSEMYGQLAASGLTSSK